MSERTDTGGRPAAEPPEIQKLRAIAERYAKLPDCPACRGAGGFGSGGFDPNSGEWMGESCEDCGGSGKARPAAKPPDVREALTQVWYLTQPWHTVEAANEALKEIGRIVAALGAAPPTQEGA